MSIRPSVFGTFGFHTRNTVPVDVIDSNDGTFAKTDAIFLGLINVLGYIPMIGLIPGIISLYPLVAKTSSMHQEPTNVKIAHYVRGIFSCLGIGALCLIPDLIATAVRFHPQTYYGRISYWYPSPGREIFGNFRLTIGRSFAEVQHLLEAGSEAAPHAKWNQ